MKYITKRNGQKELFDGEKIAKSLTLASASADKYISIVNQYYISINKDIKEAYEDGLSFFRNVEIRLITDKIKQDNTILSTKDISKYITQYLNDKITPQQYWYDALALSIALQDITHEVCDEFKLNEYEEALDTCIKRGIPFAGVQTIRSRYLKKDGKGKLIENITNNLFIVDTEELYTNHTFKTPRINYAYEEIIKAGYFSHSTPTLLNHSLQAEKRQMSSCTQVYVEDTTEGVLTALGAVCQYSRRAAGLGLHISDIREKGANIAGRKSSGGGIVSILKLFEQSIQHFDQQGQRGGALASYLNVLHPDIIDYLSSQDLGGQDDQRLHKIQLGVVIPDLFVEAVLKDEEVYLISPTTGLYNLAGVEFEQQYKTLISEGRYIRKVSALSLMLKMLSNQRAKSLFFFFRDTVFRATGEIHDGSNLCTEMILRTDNTYDGICNLGSLNMYKITKDYLYNLENDYEPEIAYINLIRQIENIAYTCAFKLLDITQLTAIPTTKGSHFNADIPTIGLGVMGMAQAIDLLLNNDVFNKKYKTIISIQDFIFKAFKGGCEAGASLWGNIHNKNVGRTRTIAPTESISVILGCTSAAEFPISNMFIKEINKTDVKIIYPFYTGKGAYDFKACEQIDLAANRQKYLDHSQSVNLFLTDKKYKQGVQSLRDDLIKTKERINKNRVNYTKGKKKYESLAALDVAFGVSLPEDIRVFKNHVDDQLTILDNKLVDDEKYITELEGIINDMQIDADKHISSEQMEAFLGAWKKGLYTLYYLRKEDTRHVTACESCAG